MRKTPVTLLPVILSGLLIACTKAVQRPHVSPAPIFAPAAKADLLQCMGAFVQVENMVDYDIFEYPETDDRSDSGDRARMVPGRVAHGIIESVHLTQSEALTGAATILLRTDRRSVMLTSAHLVVPRDTVDSYYFDEKGNVTNRLFRRAILRRSRLRVRDPEGWYHEATVVVADHRRDIAVIQSRVGPRLGREFPFAVGYHLDLTWGDWVYAVGYPKGIKQLTAGVVSPSPYRGTLTLDAVVRFGYSGGPVLAFDPLSEHLALVGMIKSVPYTQVDVVVPGEKVAHGQSVRGKDLRAERLQLIEYGSAYFVSAATLSDFFAEHLRVLRSHDIRLSSRILP